MIYTRSLIISKACLNMNPCSQRVGDSITLATSVYVHNVRKTIFTNKFIDELIKIDLLQNRPTY